jgi:hypothetical protein
VRDRWNGSNWFMHTSLISSQPSQRLDDHHCDCSSKNGGE